MASEAGGSTESSPKNPTRLNNSKSKSLARSIYFDVIGTSPQTAQTLLRSRRRPAVHPRYSAQNRKKHQSYDKSGGKRGKTHINKLVRQPIQRKVAPPRETRKQPRKSYPHLLPGNRRLRRIRKHRTFDRRQQHLRRTVEARLEDARKVRRTDDRACLLEQHAEWVFFGGLGRLGVGEGGVAALG